MENISSISAIREFKGADEVTYGVYSVTFKGKQEIFIKNGNSVGAVQHLLGSTASKCVSEIRDDVKQEFESKLKNLPREN